MSLSDRLDKFSEQYLGDLPRIIGNASELKSAEHFRTVLTLRQPVSRASLVPARISTLSLKLSKRSATFTAVGITMMPGQLTIKRSTTRIASKR